MNKKIVLIDVQILKSHEEINKVHFQKLKKIIKKDNFLNNPIIVDLNTMIILDGHHRFHSLKSLGYKKIAAYLVDYTRSEVKLYSWKSNVNVTKKQVIKAGLTGKLFQPKTTKHHLLYKPTGLKIPLTIFT